MWTRCCNSPYTQLNVIYWRATQLSIHGCYLQGELINTKLHWITQADTVRIQTLTSETVTMLWRFYVFLGKKRFFHQIGAFFQFLVGWLRPKNLFGINNENSQLQVQQIKIIFPPTKCYLINMSLEKKM